jgi:hypothetical protein
MPTVGGSTVHWKESEEGVHEMKLHKLVLVALLVSGGFAGTYSTAFAQGAPDDGSGPETRLISPQIAAG